MHRKLVKGQLPNLSGGHPHFSRAEPDPALQPPDPQILLRPAGTVRPLLLPHVRQVTRRHEGDVESLRRGDPEDASTGSLQGKISFFIVSIGKTRRMASFFLFLCQRVPTA